jgi:Flp pilus assembly protein TadG
MSPPVEMADPGERRERGAALVEFAFVLPVLLLIVLGIIDFGRAYGAKQELIHATREGVRVYVVTQDYGEARAAFDAAATGLDPARVVKVSIPDSCTPGESVAVSATYSFDFIGWWGSGNKNITSEAVMRCGG